MNTRILLAGLKVACLTVFIPSCSTLDQRDQDLGQSEAEGDKLMIVDCLLPGQVRQLGINARYLTPRRPIKTTASDCEIRGGEYTAFDRADYATALRVWMEQAKSGDPEAQTYVGEIYEKGLGLQPDYEVAALWYRRAAKQDFTRAQINLGNLYEKGLGVEADPVEALNWYRKASGLNTDNLQYASTIIATEQMQAQVAALQTEVSALEKEKQAAQTESEALRQDAIAARNAAAKEAEARMKLEEAAASAGVASAIDAPDTSLPGATLAIAAVDAQKAKQSAIGPQMQIMDPPITLTRSGPTVLLRNAVAEREIIGKVTSPVGVKAFYVNQRPVEVDEYNLFFTSIPITGSINPVAMEAVDQNDVRSQFSFSMFLDTRPEPARTIQVNYDTSSGLTEYDGISFGRYYALVIGNQDYDYYTPLNTAANDARRIAKLLAENYGFTTALLLNATRYDMLDAINRLRETLTENDNLLIYYAGHGELDSTNERGYWLPVDAQPANTSKWLSNVSISDQLNTFAARHIMVVADSCYAGTLSTASVARQAYQQPQDLQREWVEIMTEVKARTVMTSGGVRPVLDGGGGEHSVFAKSFIETLANNGQLLDGNRLFLKVLNQVRDRSRELGMEQVPDYGAIKYAGHEAGEFFLVPVI